MEKQKKADLALLFVTVGWGASFILTKNCISEMQTYNFLGIRFFIAFMISAIVFIKQIRKVNKTTVVYGVILGIILFSSFAFQTVGLKYTTASKSAFITGFSVVLVPIFSAFISKSSLPKKYYVSAVLAFVGLALLSLNGDITSSGSINIGDVYTLISAVIFAFYILFVGKYVAKFEPIALAVIQIGSVGLLSIGISLLMEKPVMPLNTKVWVSILILSVVCTSGAYIIQSIAQKFTTPTHTALIFTAEPVFAGIFSYVIYGEILTSQGILGALLILLGMVSAEVDFKIFKTGTVLKFWSN